MVQIIIYANDCTKRQSEIINLSNAEFERLIGTQYIGGYKHFEVDIYSDISKKRIKKIECDKANYFLKKIIGLSFQDDLL